MIQFRLQCQKWNAGITSESRKIWWNFSVFRMEIVSIGLSQGFFFSFALTFSFDNFSANRWELCADVLLRANRWMSYFGYGSLLSLDAFVCQQESAHSLLFLILFFYFFLSFDKITPLVESLPLISFKVVSTDISCMNSRFRVHRKETRVSSLHLCSFDFCELVKVPRPVMNVF